MKLLPLLRPTQNRDISGTTQSNDLIPSLLSTERPPAGHCIQLYINHHSILSIELPSLADSGSLDLSIIIPADNERRVSPPCSIPPRTPPRIPVPVRVLIRICQRPRPPTTLAHTKSSSSITAPKMTPPPSPLNWHRCRHRRLR
ncbi:hypothetical protein L210DRAFT_3136596 [Boletus edulis BED1]|uniref:Uncharacterized protein n=1 Tax=Boletus edulis BED1 TaxID=1328754 RepID=A0AAD4BG65_BOLED|nr:hypothetical protein L210DRAFT_3136596 [Boletus edulis BED1]